MQPDPPAFTDWAPDPRPHAKEPAVVLVRERAYEMVDNGLGYRSRRLAAAAGTFVTITRARELGLPLIDANGNPITEPAEPEPSGEVETQSLGASVETQDVKPPAVRLKTQGTRKRSKS